MGINISCCTTNEETNEELNKPEMEHQPQPIVYTYPTQDVRPIKYLPRSISNTTLAA